MEIYSVDVYSGMCEIALTESKPLATYSWFNYLH